MTAPEKLPRLFDALQCQSCRETFGWFYLPGGECRAFWCLRCALLRWGSKLPEVTR